MRSKAFFLSVAAVGMFGVACGHNYPPPQDLISARSAFARASAGPARQLSTSRLKLAKQALDSAEMAYGAAPEEEVRDRAYVAMRQAEAAEAEAAAVLASQRREKALRELASMGGERAAQARAQLMAAEQQASRERQRAQNAEQQAASEQARAQAESQRAEQGQREAAEARDKLTQEQRARSEAEERTRQALADLERLGNVRRDARGLVVTLSGQVLFATNRATLLPASESSLDSVAAALKALPPESPPVIIEGHTDSTGPRGYNIELSERRAQAVRDYLITKAVPSQRFQVRGLGPDRPVANNASPEGRANNRRVEIVIPPPAVGDTATSTAAGTQPASPSSPLDPAVPSTRPTTTPGPNPTAPRPVYTPPGPGPTPPSPDPTAPSPGSTPPSPGSTPPGPRPPSPPSPNTPPAGEGPNAPVPDLAPPTSPRSSTPPPPGALPPSSPGPQPRR